MKPTICALTYTHLAGRMIYENHFRFFTIQQNAYSLFSKLIVQRCIVGMHVLRGHELVNERCKFQLRLKLEQLHRSRLRKCNGVNLNVFVLSTCFTRCRIAKHHNSVSGQGRRVTVAATRFGIVTSCVTSATRPIER